MMNFRTMMMAAAALPMLFGGPSAAVDFSLPGVFGGRAPASDRAGEGKLWLTQATDPRVTALEEQVRQLNGTIEELNFQILQMQEQLRKMQEDNEFRFQQLEGKRTEAGTGDSAATGRVDDAPAQAQPQERAEARTQAQAPDAAPPRSGEPRVLGQITFDADGNPTGGSIVDTPQAGAAPGASSDETTVAALPQGGDADELYRNSYEFILSGDYSTAERGFRDYIERYPGDARVADAHFWLGESLLGQNRPRDAAEVFLSANREYPDSGKAPEMLLKLGVSLSQLNQRDIACATFREIGERYPQTSDALKERVKQEQAVAAC